MKTNNVFQRLAAETPVFEKSIQVLSLLVLGIVGYLVHIGFMSNATYLVFLGACPTVAIFAQFACKDVQILAAAPDLSTGLQEILSGFSDQVTQIITTFKAPPPVAANAASVTDLLDKLTNTEEAPVVQMTAPKPEQPTT